MRIVRIKMHTQESIKKERKRLHASIESTSQQTTQNVVDLAFRKVVQLQAVVANEN
jgi:hypothetical protein